MKHTLVLLQLEHRGIAALLGTVEAHCVKLALREPINRDLLQLVMVYFCDYPDACHHPKEDLVFRRLRARAPDAAAKVADLLGGHEALHELTLETAAIVERMDEVTPAALRAALQRFVHAYRQHLHAEDEHFFPAVAAHLTPEDWDLIDFQMFDQEDPLLQEAVEHPYGDLVQTIRDSQGAGDWWPPDQS